MKTLAALLALCEGNPPVMGGFPLIKCQKYRALIYHFLSAKHVVDQTDKLLVISDAMMPMLRLCNNKTYLFLSHLQG